MIRLKTTIVISLEEIARIYRYDIWKIQKVPKKILNNRRPQFTSYFMKDLCKALETKNIDNDIPLSNR